MTDMDRLRELVSYDAITGILRWLPRKPQDFATTKFRTAETSCDIWNTKYAGKPAFTAKDNYGYHTGAIFEKPLKAHRVAFALHHGKWPEQSIDHINRNRADNRIANLRDVSHKENMQNRGPQDGLG